MDANFWKSKKVFLTGHNGFKGSWLSLWLRAMGAEVCGYALEPPTTPSLFELLRLEGEMDSRRGDVRDLATLEAAMREFAPEIVFHLAAQPLVRLSYQQPAETYAVNVMGTVHVLDAVRRLPSVRAVVIVTSDKCYENRERQRPYGEQEPMGGFDPYSSSKGCAELVTSAYRRSFFPPQRWLEHRVGVASVRAGNVIGGGDWATDRLIPDVMRAWSAGREVGIRNPGSVRPWQHVLDPLNGYLMLAERLCADGENFSEGWNFGPAEGDARPVRYLLTELGRLWGAGAKWYKSDPEPEHEAQTLRLDASKAAARLGWTPRWRLAESMAATVEWYRAFYSGVDVRVLSLEQIERFQQPEPDRSIP